MHSNAPADPNPGRSSGRTALALVASEARYRTLFDHAQVGILLADAASVYLDANPYMCRLLGYRREELIGMHAADIVAPSETANIDAALGDIQASAGHRREWRFRRKDGSQVTADVVATRMPDGTLLGLVRERDEAELALRDHQRFTDMMIESMPGAVYFYDSHGRFLRWNRNFETVTGYTAAEIASMQPQDFFPPEDHQRLAERIGEVFIRGESSLEAMFRAKDGTLTPYYFTGRRVEYGGGPCLVGVGIDLSQRRLTEARLAESERQYRELVEHANSVILRWDSDGRITFVNAYGLRFFGWSAEEIIGRHVLDTIVPPTESGGRDLRRLMQDVQADPASFEQNVNENMRRNGERVWMSWTNRIVRDAQGRVTEILSIGSDITARRQAEAERERRHRAEEADRIKSAFLATMSHELRTPLNSIIGFTGIILQGLAGPLNDEQRRQLDMVRGSARHLLALVNDVLDISKIEAGQFEIARERFDPAASLARVVELVKPQAATKGLELRVDPPPPLGEAFSDERRFRQVLINLLSNAIKFTDRGWIGISSRLVQDGRCVEVRISDSGMGIRNEDLPHLFQPFRQIDAGLSRNHDGTGLGLAICRRLCELMGGTIHVESAWGHGSTFTVTMPLHAPEAS